MDEKEIGGSDEKIKELEKRIELAEQSLCLYGTVFTILKRFFDAIPNADKLEKREEVKQEGKKD